MRLQVKIKMLRNLLGVENLAKPEGKTAGSLFASAEVGFNVGTVLFVGEELTGKFSPGQKIYFGAQRETIRMDGKEVMVMKEENVYALAEDSK